MSEQYQHMGSMEKLRLECIVLMAVGSFLMLPVVLFMGISFFIFSDKMELFAFIIDWHHNSNFFFWIKFLVFLITIISYGLIRNMILDKMFEMKKIYIATIFIAILSILLILIFFT
ncbi:MAG: hypothetical protein JXR78_08755 [Victivallales bacterium]|nr:hypothetical protein [Victivallales bacterium]